MARHSTTDCFQALADPSRREILMMLSKEKQSINSIADNFDISRPAVSRHIKVLYNAGFIVITDQGRERYCELDHSGFDEVKEWITFFEKYWTTQMKNLQTFLDKKAPQKKKKK
jgi:DNA-binding transcriptional ArsR family regulator